MTFKAKKRKQILSNNKINGNNEQYIFFFLHCMCFVAFSLSENVLENLETVDA